jgi:phenylacetate-coenzyme A ligase PaaK-like adenylate-forming protein
VIFDSKIFNVKTEAEFQGLALEIFHFQKSNCSVYGEYLRLLGRENPKSISEIPFLPIQFFKSHEVLSKPKTVNETLFLSSGTGLIGRSKHLVSDVSIYEQSFRKAYELQFGDPKKQVILALLPNYIEQGNSSLVFMVNDLINRSENELSGFLLNDFDELRERYNSALSSGKKVVIFGVSYALLDLAEQGFDLSKALIIETGGMKGRREELSKAELHNRIKNGLGVEYVSSEYGMTELLSQAYSEKNGVFQTPPWMKVIFSDVYDPLTVVDGSSKSLINVIDLANINSCSFIQTQDLGRKVENGFVLEGRLDLSDIRGCNLMVD